MADDSPCYAIGDLADLGDVSRRTVRYYVQEGLLPSPFGLGRGRHYGPEHLERLLKIKGMQEEGRTLDEIRQLLAGRGVPRRVAPRAAEPLPRSLWRRLTLAPGVELHVANTASLPPPGRLQELVDWCRLNFPRNEESEENHE
jgi:DNA-binding transcriptional MerR regulator